MSVQTRNVVLEITVITLITVENLSKGITIFKQPQHDKLVR